MAEDFTVTMATTDMNTTLERVERDNRLLRRNSTGNFGIENTSLKVIPHYLQASAPSCHDYCKYGHRNTTSETKARNTFPPKYSLVPDKIHHLAGTENVVPRNKKPVLTPKPSQDVKSWIQLHKSEAVKKEIPRSSKKVDAILKQVFEPNVLDLKPKVLQMKPSSLPPSKSLTRRHSDIVLLTKSLGANEAGPLGSPSSRRNIEMGIGKDINSPKTSKKSQLAITVSMSPKSRVKTFLTKNAGNVKSPRKVSNITKQKSLRKVDPTKKPVEEEVPGKTLYVVEPIAENRSNISLPSPKSETESSIKGHNGLQIKEDRETNIPDQKAENKRRPIRVGKMTSDNENCSPRKLKFRKGKVVSVGSEIMSPRKLKFKAGKVLDDNLHIWGDERRVVKVKRLVSGGAFKDNNKSESPKVVLRHQDVEERKDTQSSFNNVIEETASKLVETRKSKVKALVGAFESLISPGYQTV